MRRREGKKRGGSKEEWRGKEVKERKDGQEAKTARLAAARVRP